LIEEKGKEYVVLWSPETAEHDPDYRELGRFPRVRRRWNSFPRMADTTPTTASTHRIMIPI
jgi:hypothetical protein